MVRNATIYYSKYKLQVAGYSRTAGDSILYDTEGHYLNEMAFSTYDSSHAPGGNCARSYNSGCWYNSCMCSLLNGPYCHDTSWQGVHLLTFTGYSRSLTFVEMKLTARLVRINSYYATMVTFNINNYY